MRQASGPIGRALPVLTSLGSGDKVVLVSNPFVGVFQGVDAFNARTGKCSASPLAAAIVPVHCGGGY